MFRVGIIGVGNIGSTHVNSFLSGRVKNAKITALCDIDREHLYKFKDQFSFLLLRPVKLVFWS